VRKMLFDYPEGWYMRSSCGQRHCIEPEHQILSMSRLFTDTDTPIKLKPPKMPRRTPAQMDKDFLEV
jgi:hypothetical protein